MSEKMALKIAAAICLLLVMVAITASFVTVGGDGPTPSFRDADRTITELYKQQQDHYARTHAYVADKGRKRNCGYEVIPRRANDPIPADLLSRLSLSAGHKTQSRDIWMAQNLKDRGALQVSQSDWFVISAICEVTDSNLAYGVLGSPDDQGPIQIAIGLSTIYNVVIESNTKSDSQ